MRAVLLCALIACKSSDRPVHHETPPTPAPLPSDPVVKLFSGDGEVCATRASGTVLCWGGGGADREAKPPHVAIIPTIATQPGSAVPVTDPVALHRRVRASGGCALEVAGTVTCWGELDPRSHRVLAPTRTSALGKLDRLAPNGTDALCALRGGDVACWSAKALVEAIDGKPVEPRVIARVPDDPWIDVVENCALRKSGRVFCWGDNSRGQVTGIGDTRERAAPLVEPARPRVFGSFDESPWCAVIDNGSVVCWPADRPALRVPPPQDDEVLQIVPAIYGACALMRSGRVMCWVHGDSQRFVTTPQPVPGLGDAAALASVGGRMCAVSRAGRVMCGYGSPEPKPLSAVAGVDDAIGVAVSKDYACALRKAGTVRCWGTRYWNGSAIVDGDSEHAFEPPGVPALAKLVTPRAESESYLCGIGQDHALWCWGRPACRAQACRLRAAGEVSALAAGPSEFGHTTYYAVQAGHVLSWRDDQEAVARRDDVQSAVDVKAGMTAACATHDDGAVSCWGRVGERLNDGHRSRVAEPVEVDVAR